MKPISNHFTEEQDKELNAMCDKIPTKLDIATITKRQFLKQCGVSSTEVTRYAAKVIGLPPRVAIDIIGEFEARLLDAFFGINFPKKED